MALDALAQVKWSAKLLQVFEDAHVYKKGTNQDYDDEISSNAAVRIFTPARPTTSTYTRDSTTISYERLTPGEQIFIVDQRRHWGIKVDSLEKHLAMGGGKMWQEEISGGAFELADDVDDFLRDLMAAGVAADNVLNPRVLGIGAMSSNAYDLIVEMEVKLRKGNVPEGGWHIFCPPEFSGLVARDERFTGFNTPDARRTIRGGLETKIRSFTYHETNNAPVSGSTYTIIACSEKSTTYGEQLSKLRFIEKTAGDFDERADSELVFGGKVTRPEAIVTCAAQFAS